MRIIPIFIYIMSKYAALYLYLYILFYTFARKEQYMWQEMSNPAILAKIGRRLKDIRIKQNMTQGELAERAGMSILTVANIEKGKPVSILLFLCAIRELGLLENLELLVPETKISPIELKRMQGKKRYRVRHTKDNNHE